ncbi:hypothetical protein SESBI_06429 [Sesbania bispinosa]|nr:hypothetical protein SESBI_06429 [Sesbania bispinosa]
MKDDVAALEMDLEIARRDLVKAEGCFDERHLDGTQILVITYPLYSRINVISSNAGSDEEAREGKKWRISTVRGWTKQGALPMRPTSCHCYSA